MKEKTTPTSDNEPLVLQQHTIHPDWQVRLFPFRWMNRTVEWIIYLRHSPKMNPLNIERICYTLIQRHGANIIMNGDWFDCNRCGAIILRSAAVCYNGTNKFGVEEDDKICQKFGAICCNCYDAMLIAKFETQKYETN